MLELTLKNKRINFIGDPHLGKNFGGVPLHRRGEREESQFKQFSDELNSNHDITIMVGDLFDTFNVSNDVLLRTMNVITEAAYANPNKQYYFIFQIFFVCYNFPYIRNIPILFYFIWKIF